MVWNLPELSLDLSPPAVSYCKPGFLTRFPVAGNRDSDELSKLRDFIDGLENEHGKIEAFKRELPLSFLLLNDAIDKLKEEARKHEERRSRCKLGESAGVKTGIDQSEKKSWMSSAQLWSPRYEEEDSGFSDDAVPGLSLVTPGFDTQATVESDSTEGKLSGLVMCRTVDQTAKSAYSYHQTARKQRRCWSPDLHRRFVDALEKLGGSQVATPKQIRELMQVDGLTNDEVKSHLQKYRLHIRKLSSSSTSNPSSNDNDASTGKDEVDELGSSIRHIDSPVGSLHLTRSEKCNSTSMEEDEDEEKSNVQNWKLHDHTI